jgi:hypothetical protein
LKYGGFLRREKTNAVVAGLASEGVPVKELVRRTGRSRELVRQIVRDERTDVFRTRQGSLDRHLPFSRRAVGRRLSHRRRALALSSRSRLPRLDSHRQRVDDAATAICDGDNQSTLQSPVGKIARSPDDAERPLVSS